MGAKAEKAWKSCSADFRRFLGHAKLATDALSEKAQDRKWFEQRVMDLLWVHRQRARAQGVLRLQLPGLAPNLGRRGVEGTKLSLAETRSD